LASNILLTSFCKINFIAKKNENWWKTFFIYFIGEK